MNTPTFRYAFVRELDRAAKRQQLHSTVRRKSRIAIAATGAQLVTVIALIWEAIR